MIAVALTIAVALSEAGTYRVIDGFVPYRNHSGARIKRSIVEMTGAGICVLDFDLDGDPDVYFPDGGAPHAPGATNRLFRNDGGLRFTEVTDAAGVGDPGWAGGCAVGDIDNDGDPDLYVTNTGPNVLYRNNGDGTFTDATREAGVGHAGWSTGAAFADLDADGLLDLYVCNYIDRARADLEARCRYFGIEVFCGPNGLPGEADVLYRNLDGRSFADVTGEAGVHSPETRGFSVLLTDLDGDRLPEIRVANDATIDLLFHNRGNMRFEDRSLISGTGYSGSGLEQSGMGSAAGDYDGDGDFDLYVTNFQRDYNTLFENEDRLIFRDVTTARGLGAPTLAFLGWGVHFLDADNDGDLDLFVANGHIYPELEDHPEIGEPYAQRNQLFLGDGAGGFVETELPERARVSRGTAVADLDGDGALDVLVNNLDDAPGLYVGRARGTWLRVRLVGTEANRDGLGTLVTVRSRGREQHLELRGSDGYLGSNEAVLHFGLGGPGTREVEEIVVRWPSGHDDRITEIGAHRVYRIKEGVGTLR